MIPLPVALNALAPPNIELWPRKRNRLNLGNRGRFYNLPLHRASFQPLHFADFERAAVRSEQPYLSHGQSRSGA